MAIPIVARDAAGNLFQFRLSDPGVKRWAGNDSTLFFVFGQWYQRLEETHIHRYKARMDSANSGPGFVDSNYPMFITREQARDWFIAKIPIAPPPDYEILPDELADLRPANAPTTLAASQAMTDLSRDHLLPFQPAPFRAEHLSDELFIAANYAVAFLHSASLLKGLHWQSDMAERRPLHAGCIADAAKFILGFAVRCQNAFRPVTHALTAVRPNGPFSIGEFSQENAHWVAYRIGIAAQSRLSSCLGPSVRYRLHSEDTSSLVAAILQNWDSCKEAMTSWDMPDENKVEAEIRWEATQAEKNRREKKPGATPTTNVIMPSALADSPPDVPLDQSTMAAGQGMIAHLSSLAATNTTMRNWIVDLGAQHTDTVTFHSDGNPITESASIPTSSQPVTIFDIQALAAALGDENAAKILKVAHDDNLSVDQKCRLIATIDCKYYGYDSSEWTKLLRRRGKPVSDGAIRQTTWWREDRPKWRNDNRADREEDRS